MGELSYPIGHFECPREITSAHIMEWTRVLEMLPERLGALTKNLAIEQQETPYRPGGWTIRQVIHQLPIAIITVIPDLNGP